MLRLERSLSASRSVDAEPAARQTLSELHTFFCPSSIMYGLNRSGRSTKPAPLFHQRRSRTYRKSRVGTLIPFSWRNTRTWISRLPAIFVSRESGTLSSRASSPRPCGKENGSSRCPTSRNRLERSVKYSTTTCVTSPARCNLPRQAIMLADRIRDRYASNTDDQRIRLAWLVSSSMVTNRTPCALPGRWRTRMMPATSSREPSPHRGQFAATDDAALGQILPQETDGMATQAQPDAAVILHHLPTGGHRRQRHRRFGVRFGGSGVEQRQPLIRQAADRPQRLPPVQTEDLERVRLRQPLQRRDQERAAGARYPRSSDIPHHGA